MCSSAEGTRDGEGKKNGSFARRGAASRHTGWHRWPGNPNKRQRPPAVPQRNKGKELSNLFNLSGWLITGPRRVPRRARIFRPTLCLRGTETRRKPALNTAGNRGFMDLMKLTELETSPPGERLMKLIATMLFRSISVIDGLRDRR